MALKPSERLTLMKEIAKRLTVEGWPFIDATLKAFSLPTSDSWNGSMVSYVLQMIGEAPDNSLMELAEHVGFQFDSKPTRVDPPFWRKGLLRLFITHLSAHRTFATQLQAELLGFGISSFVAHSDIEPTLEWQNEIEAALSTCDALVALLHPDFHRSKWTDQEIGFAMGRGVPVCAVRFGEDPYGFIGRFQAFNGNGKKASRVSAEIFEAFRKHKQTQRRMADVLIAMFADSPSFADSKTRMGYLEELTVWEPSYPSRLRSAVKRNHQIADSFGVADRVEKLIKKWAKRVES